MLGTPTKGKRFGGDAAHQKAMFGNLVASLIAAEHVYGALVLLSYPLHPPGGAERPGGASPLGRSRKKPQVWASAANI